MAPSPLPPTAAVLLALALLVARSTLATIPLYCRAGTLGGSTLGVANLTVWEAARQCSNRSLLGGRCAGWTTPEVYPAVCDPKSTVVYQIQFKDKNSLGRPVTKTGWSYFRASPLPPLPSPPPPPPPTPPSTGTVRLTVLPGTAVEPYFFGWDLEGWTDAMDGTSFPFNDTGGLALTKALSPGVLRYPGGTGSNLWNLTSGHFLPPLDPRGYSGYKPLAKYDNALPDGLLGAATYLRGLGGVAKRAIWNLNVYTYTVNETCDAIQTLSELPGQQEPGVMLELGNEFYIGGQGRPKFRNAAEYAQYVTPIVACARRLMPKALVGAVGCPGAWNRGLRPYVHLFDGITLHNYSPRTRESLRFANEGDRFSWYAGYSRASAQADVAQMVEDLGGVKKPIWLTEFQAGLDPPTNCLMPQYIFGTLHGAFHAGRVIAAINQLGDYGVLTWQTFVSPVDYPRFPNDWCGQAAGLIKSPQGPNRPDLVQVTGGAQLVAHMFRRALAMETMHPVNFTGGPTVQVLVLGEPQPCLQAAAFLRSGSAHMVLAVLNICNTTIPISLNSSSTSSGKAPTADGSSAVLLVGATTNATVYKFDDRGGKAPLPDDPSVFPWAGPLTGVVVTGSEALTAEPLSFAIVEVAQEK
jgi:hypothetical protein